MLDEKELHRITLDDLIELVDIAAPENVFLEFKKEPYGQYSQGKLNLRQEDKREMLKDISGMANAFGGHIVIGVEENRHGQAARLCPVSGPYEIKQTITDLCCQGIQDMIHGLQVHVVEKSQGMDGFIIIRVPNSRLKPHMVSIHGLASFNVRVENAIRPMGLGEIQAAILNSPRFERFHRKELTDDEIQSIGGHEDVPLDELPYVEAITSHPAQRFWRRFLRDDIYPQRLIIVSPFITRFEGYLVGFSKILEKCRKNSIRLHIVTRSPEDESHSIALKELSGFELADVRFIQDLHGKLFISSSADEEQSFAMVGSANLTARGLYHNIEIGLMVYGRGHGAMVIENLYRWAVYALRTQARRAIHL